MQRSKQTYLLLTWALAGMLPVLLSGSASAQAVNGPARPGSTNKNNNSRQSARAPINRTAPNNSRVQSAARPQTAQPSGRTPAGTKPQSNVNAARSAAAPAGTTQVTTPRPTAPLAAAAVSPNASSSPSGTYALKHRLRVGELIRTRTIHVVNTITRIQGVEDVSESKTVSDKVWEVHDVTPEGHMTLEYRIDAVDMSQKQGDKDETTYNSRTDKEAPPMFARVAETIDKPIAIVTIDTDGSIIERDKQAKTPSLGMGELAVPLPKEPVAIGAQWNIPRECRVKLEDGTQKVMKYREQYTLEKVSAGVATIRVQSQPLTPVTEPSVKAQLMQQMSSGVIKFDVDRGRLISRQLDWDDEVVSFRGAESSLKYSARFTEEQASEEQVSEPTRSASAAGAKSRK